MNQVTPASANSAASSGGPWRQTSNACAGRTVLGDRGAQLAHVIGESGPSGRNGTTPSHRAARRTGFGRGGQSTADQIGMRGCWSGGGQETNVVDAQPATAIGHRLPRPQAVDDLDAVVEQLGARGVVGRLRRRSR